jgi:uncharacterized MAPEG superfamily protein
MTIAIACILIAGILPIVSASIAKAGFKGYDNHNPRDWLARQTGFRARANAAQANAWEAFPFFAAAVLSAQFMTVPQPRIDALAIGFVVARVIYLALYLADRAALRSVVWTIGWGLCIALFTARLW